MCKSRERGRRTRKFTKNIQAILIEMGEKEDLRIFHVEIFYFQQKGIAENENKVISHQRAALELAAKGKKKDFPGAKADFDAEKPCEIVLGLKIS